MAQATLSGAFHRSVTLLLPSVVEEYLALGGLPMLHGATARTTRGWLTHHLHCHLLGPPSRWSESVGWSLLLAAKGTFAFLAT